MARGADQNRIMALFGRSQSWVSKRQSQADDPMPRDLAGARAWGIRVGLLSDSGEALQFEQTPAPSPVALKDMELKSARTEKLQIEIALKRGELLRKEDVERMQVRSAAEFRRAACDYPNRARTVLERFITDAAVIDQIMRGLEPLGVELLNRADPKGLLKTHSKEDVRVALLARVEEILACI